MKTTNNLPISWFQNAYNWSYILWSVIFPWSTDYKEKAVLRFKNLILKICTGYQAAEKLINKDYLMAGRYMHWCGEFPVSSGIHPRYFRYKCYRSTCLPRHRWSFPGASGLLRGSNGVAADFICFEFIGKRKWQRILVCKNNSKAFPADHNILWSGSWRCAALRDDHGCRQGGSLI